MVSQSTSLSSALPDNRFLLKDYEKEEEDGVHSPCLLPPAYSYQWELGAFYLGSPLFPMLVPQI